MGRPRGWAAARTARPPMRSPGRPPVARREPRQRFWAAVAEGLSGEEAAVRCGVSPAVALGGSARTAACRRSARGRCRSATCPLPSGKRSPLCAPQGVGVREIARRLGRAASTISWELRRNAATRGGRLDYRASTAQWHADRRARRPKIAELAANERLRRYVQDRLSGEIARPDGRPMPAPAVTRKGRRHGRRTDRCWARAWSPEQIANRLPVDFPDDESMRISHEAVLVPASAVSLTTVPRYWVSGRRCG
jgi:transposase